MMATGVLVASAFGHQQRLRGGRNVRTQLLASAGAGEDLRHDVQVCLEEALANLILHAQPRDGDKHIRLRLTASSDGATLIVSDRCVPYDITEAIPRSALPAPGEIRAGGNGVTLIRAFADPSVGVASISAVSASTS